MNSITEIIEDLRSGRMVILVDDENRENEGDLIMAADFITPQAVNFMATEARGLICLSLAREQIQRLGLSLMVKDDFNRSPNKTAFTVSIEAATGVSTGISAADRAHTIRVAANPLSTSQDIITPGHVFPIIAQPGGVLKRAGHTEASLDLARLAGLNQAAVICEIMNPDGTMARVDELKQFATKHGLKIGTIESLIQHRIETESFIEESRYGQFSSRFGGDFQVRVFTNTLNGRQHFALVKGDIAGDEPVLVRMHAENVMGDAFGDLRYPSGEFLHEAMSMVAERGRGVIIYLRNEDSGSRLSSDVNMDEKDYGVGAQILRSLGLKKIVLISNNPTKRVGLKGYGIEIVDSIAIEASVPKTASLGLATPQVEARLEH